MTRLLCAPDQRALVGFMTSATDFYVTPAIPLPQAPAPAMTRKSHRIGVVGPRLVTTGRLLYERLYARLIEDAALTSRETTFFLDTSEVGYCALDDLVLRHDWPRERLRLIATEDETLGNTYSVHVQRFSSPMAVGAAIANMTDDLLCFLPGFSMIEAQLGALVADRRVGPRNAVPTDLDDGMRLLVRRNLQKHYRSLAPPSPLARAPTSSSSPPPAPVAEQDSASSDDSTSSGNDDDDDDEDEKKTISSLSSPADADKGNDTDTTDDDDGRPNGSTKDSNLAFGADTETMRKRKRKPVDRYNPSQKVPRTERADANGGDDDDQVDDINQDDSWSEGCDDESSLSLVVSDDADDDVVIVPSSKKVQVDGDDADDDDAANDKSGTEKTLKQVVEARRRASDARAESFFPLLDINFYIGQTPVVSWGPLDQRLIDQPSRFSGVFAGIPMTISCCDALRNWPSTLWFRTLCSNVKMVSSSGSARKERALHVLARLAYCGRVTAVSPCGGEDEPLERCDICGLSRAHHAGVKIIIHGPLLNEEAALLAEAGLNNAGGTSSKSTLKFPLYLWAGSHCGELALRIIYLFTLLGDTRNLVWTMLGDSSHSEIVKVMRDRCVPRRLELAARAVEHVFDKTANPQGFACTPLIIGSKTPTAPFWFGKSLEKK